jgi:hypothetical protein
MASREAVWAGLALCLLRAAAVRSGSERVMHVARYAVCMDVSRTCHPGVRRDPDPGDRLDARARRSVRATVASSSALMRAASSAPELSPTSADGTL